jgi:error-prone DNA polymerase
LRLTNEILDAPRHLSIHPGGFLLGHDPVHTIVPIENATMPGRTVIQWDKDDLEALGLFKVDLLGLGALTHLDLSFRLLRQHRGIELSMATIPPDDPAAFEMIRGADTVGVFQIESRAQMAMLPRLKPRHFYDLVIEVSLVRPGPITGGMVHPYLRRRSGEEPVDYPHPSLKPVLEKTLGVPLFQEQVMRLAIVAADYTPGEADQLRRDMAAWRRTSRIERHRHRLISRMQAKGITPEFAERVFTQIRGFGEYGFPESHAASFALIAYATAWLKCHYPAEFTCALLNAQPMGFTPRRPSWRTRSATASCPARGRAGERLGLHPGAVPRERGRLRGAHGPALREGLGEATGAGSKRRAASRPSRRSRFRPPHGADKGRSPRWPRRAPSRASALGAAIGAVGCTRAHSCARRLAPDRTRERGPAFAPEPLRGGHLGLPEHRPQPRRHPLAPVRCAQDQGLPDARAVAAMRDGRRVRYAGLVICRQQPGTAQGVTFMTLEDETGFVNVVLWPSVFARYAVLAKTATFLGITGTLQAQQGVVHLVADRLWKPKLGRAPASTPSRDFRQIYTHVLNRGGRGVRSPPMASAWSGLLCSPIRNRLTSAAVFSRFRAHGEHDNSSTGESP